MNYQIQLQNIDAQGNIVKMYPVNTSDDVVTGLVDSAISLRLPGSYKDETIKTSISCIRKYLENLQDLATNHYTVSSNTMLDDETSLATSAAVKQVNDLAAMVDSKIEEVKQEYAIKNHAIETTDYGAATGTLYGHVKLSDTYTSKLSNGAAANGLAASQNALYNAYNALYQQIQDVAVKPSGGHVVSDTAPSETSLLWIDTTAGNVIKFYNSETDTWDTVSSTWG